jgi:hypothetical protein
MRTICGILLITLLIVCFLAACDKQEIAAPDSGDDPTGGIEDSDSLWIEVLPDRLSVVILRHGQVKGAREYELWRSDGDSLDYREIPGPPSDPYTWVDANVREDSIYYYKLVGVSRGENLGSTPATGITVRFPGSVLKFIEQAYVEGDVEALQGVLSEDYTYTGRGNLSREVLSDRSKEVTTHQRMFDRSSLVNRVVAIDLAMEAGQLKRIPEEDHVGMRCFELPVDVNLRLAFDRERAVMKSFTFDGQALFHIKHDKTDPTKWVIYRWVDP